MSYQISEDVCVIGWHHPQFRCLQREKKEIREENKNPLEMHEQGGLQVSAPGLAHYPSAPAEQNILTDCFLHCPRPWRMEHRNPGL